MTLAPTLTTLDALQPGQRATVIHLAPNEQPHSAPLIFSAALALATSIDWNGQGRRRWSSGDTIAPGGRAHLPLLRRWGTTQFSTLHDMTSAWMPTTITSFVTKPLRGRDGKLRDKLKR